MKKLILGSASTPYRLVTLAVMRASPCGVDPSTITVNWIGVKMLLSGGPKYAEAKTLPRESGYPWPVAMPKAALTSYTDWI